MKEIIIEKHNNVIINDNFMNFFNLCYKRISKTLSTPELNLIFFKSNVLLLLKDESRYKIQTDIYIYGNILIIDKNNQYYNEISDLFKLKTFFENGRQLKRAFLKEEEILYLKLKYNVYDGFWDFQSIVELEIKYADN